MRRDDTPHLHSDPTYVVDGVVHYGVANMPGVVPRTSTIALSNTVLPYVLELANSGIKEAVMRNPHLANGLNVAEGRITHAGVADALHMEGASVREGAPNRVPRSGNSRFQVTS